MPPSLSQLKLTSGSSVTHKEERKGPRRKPEGNPPSYTGLINDSEVETGVLLKTSSRQGRVRSRRIE